MTKLLTAVLATTLTGILTLTGGLAALTSSPAALCTTSAASTSNTTPGPATTVPPRAESGGDSDQLANAAAIITVGTRLAVPPRGQIIALAAAIQESGLRNLPYGDRDSLGLFQQRPSAGWGTPAQILNPAYAATRFYTALLAVPDWQNLPLTIAAQHVERSSVPKAYARHEAAATHLYATITGTNPGHASLGNVCPNSGVTPWTAVRRH